MKIFIAAIVPRGWEKFYFSQAKEELKRYGRIIHQFPSHTNCGGWFSQEALRSPGYEVFEFDCSMEGLIEKNLFVQSPFLFSMFDDVKNRFPKLQRRNEEIMNKKLLQRVIEVSPNIFLQQILMQFFLIL